MLDNGKRRRKTFSLGAVREITAIVSPHVLSGWNATAENKLKATYCTCFYIASPCLLSLSKVFVCVRTKPINGYGWSKCVRICPRTRKYTIINCAAWHDVAAKDSGTKTNVAAEIFLAASGSGCEWTMEEPLLALRQMRNRALERLNCHWRNTDFHPSVGSGWDSWDWVSVRLSRKPRLLSVSDKLTHLPEHKVNFLIPAPNAVKW